MTLRETQQQETRFVEVSSLPATTRLALQRRTQLEPMLFETPTSWPFEDRVFVLLLPSFMADVRGFHDQSGEPMVRLFRQHQLASIDAALERKLFDLIDGL